MKVEFLRAAQSELSEASAYYNAQREGLGDEFVAEVRETVGRILGHPEAWPRLSARTRRCLTKRFPYGVLYQIRNDRLLVVAVTHLKRKPNTWRSRLKPDEA